MSIVSALGLYILVSIFSSGTESESRWKILVIAIASGVLLALVSGAIPGLAGLMIAILCALVLIAAGLIFWCGVQRNAALKIVGSYCALCVALTIAVSVLGAVAHRG